MKSAVKKATNVLNQLIRQRNNWLNELKEDQRDLAGFFKLEDSIEERYESELKVIQERRDKDLGEIRAKIDSKKDEMVKENKVELEKYSELIADARVSLEKAKGKS